MAKIYSMPKDIKIPDFKPKQSFAEYEKELEKVEEELRKALKARNPKGECVGEIIHFPVADGNAQYMVAGLKPVELVHLPVMDAWVFDYAHRLTAKDVREKIASQKALNKLFGGK